MRLPKMWHFNIKTQMSLCSLLLRIETLSSVSNLPGIDYTSDWQRLWPDCAYAQAGLSLCLSHIPHCWKSHAVAHIWTFLLLFRKHALTSYNICFALEQRAWVIFCVCFDFSKDIITN